MQTNVIFNTAGDGLWSSVDKPVRVTGIELGPGMQFEGEDRIFGELCVYFDTSTWNPDTDGLIYTDSQFISELRNFLTAQGLPADVDYSEQGMQGDDYVSLDAGTEFYKAWMAKFNIAREDFVEEC